MIWTKEKWTSDYWPKRLKMIRDSPIEKEHTQLGLFNIGALPIEESLNPIGETYKFFDYLQPLGCFLHNERYLRHELDRIYFTMKLYVHKHGI